jgi:hypothetical protein
MESWPSTVLPLPQLEFSGQNESNAIRTVMASGRIRQRRRFSLDLKTMNVSWLMNEQQFHIFQSWVYLKVAGGSDWFELDLNLGNGLVTYLVRMVEGKYAFSLRSPNFSVTTTLEIEDQQYMDEATLDAAIASGVINVPTLLAFDVDLAEGDTDLPQKTITFPQPFGAIIPIVKVQLISPVDGFVFEILVPEEDITSTNFKVNISALSIPGPGYSLHVFAAKPGVL